jgi:hypothetical protein
MNKIVSYKGVKADKPENISMSLFKRVVDECGKDYCITVQNVITLLSNVIKNPSSRQKTNR